MYSKSPSELVVISDGALFGLHGQDVKRAIHTGETLTPFPISFTAAGVEDKVDGFEGYEALVLDGERVWLTGSVDEAKF